MSSFLIYAFDTVNFSFMTVLVKSQILVMATQHFHSHSVVNITVCFSLLQELFENVFFNFQIYDMGDLCGLNNYLKYIKLL